MDVVTLIISLLSGIAGGNAAGAVLPKRSLGFLGDSLAGLFGGGIGGFILQFLGLIATTGISGADGSIDIASILANITSSGVGGAVLLLVVSFIKGLLK